MRKVTASIKKRPLNLILIVLAAVLYALNNGFLKSSAEGILRVFFVCYFNDLICPLFFLSYANLLLITCDREIKSISGLLLLGTASGLVWEFAAPFLKKGAVADYRDLICYLAGTIGYWGLLQFSLKKVQRPGETGR